MDRLQQKIDDIRPWLQFVIAPVASLWVAAAIADSRGTSALIIGLLIGMVLSVFFYFLSRKITDGFWLVFLGFVFSAAGIAAAFSIGNKLSIGDFSVSRILLLGFPPAAFVSFANFIGKIHLPKNGPDYNQEVNVSNKTYESYLIREVKRPPVSGR